ncbi:uncharacterized protein N7529_000995 [Penicillium soppii]|uniref:uncharacterized protein n=1 Tax=Penicillium soppii TaxID=69789 RepID=UPI002547B8FB|nr:uncharacterized protein N7529_000995 [Penicillium soppii]KAJ5882323.1 hypothetical protein N7529_000995 [Penicillium soppii]
MPHNPTKRERDRTAMSYPVRQTLFCLFCLEYNLRAWIENGRLRARKRLCEMLPAGLEGHRFELLSLVSWFGAFWRNNLVARNLELVEVHAFPAEALARLASKLEKLIDSFALLMRNHVATHDIEDLLPSPTFDIDRGFKVVA